MSEKYKKLKENTATTVGELKKLLEQYKDDINISSAGTDFGGCDTSYQKYIGLELENNTLYFSHFEKKAWDLLKQKEITEKEAKDLMGD